MTGTRVRVTENPREAQKEKHARWETWQEKRFRGWGSGYLEHRVLFIFCLDGKLQILRLSQDEVKLQLSLTMYLVAVKHWGTLAIPQVVPQF